MSRFDGGPWTERDHLEVDAMIPLDEKMFEAIGESIYYLFDDNELAAIDIGCGRGHLLAYLRENGRVKVAHGIEPDESISPIVRSVFIHHADITKRDPQKAAFCYDVICCIEVIEHIDSDKHDIVFDHIEAMSRTKRQTALYFSGATPGQLGDGHIGCRPESEWRYMIEKRGFKLQSDHTQKIRIKSTLPWHKQNMMVFVREKGE